jgi:Animal haem peroxidase
VFHSAGAIIKLLIEIRREDTMSAHGAPSGFGNIAVSADTDSGYRNLFGDPSDSSKRYTGFGSGLKGRERNRRMLRWLAMRFGRPYWERRDNRRIPAGYTYLAQFVIHDTVQSLADLPDLDYETGWMRNARSSRLVLDTIYGKGPGADPLFYEGGPTPQATGFLRIGACQDDPGLRRDLPRSPCPFAKKQEYPDVLIADARNDDNLILGQVTVLFHLLHNIVYAKLHKINKVDKKNMSDTEVFSLARRVVTRIYRDIVFKDLLQKILHPEIYKRYMSSREAALIDQGRDTRMILEFSHAAARFGHFMARNQYKINDELPEQGVKAMLRQTSAARPFDMPLAAEWLVDWTTLFDASGLKARRFGPEMAPTLVSNDLEVLFGEFNDPTRGRPPKSMGGLAYRDMVRGAESHLRSAKSIVEELDRKETRLLKLSPLVDTTAAAKIDTTKVEKWLESGSGDGMTETPHRKEYIDCIKKDIPLLLLIMIEAANTKLPAPDNIEEGECLGAIGSVIVAECLFREYWRTYAFIEGDGLVEKSLESVFGREPVDTMPRMIAEISRRVFWANSKAMF